MSTTYMPIINVNGKIYQIRYLEQRTIRHQVFLTGLIIRIDGEILNVGIWTPEGLSVNTDGSINHTEHEWNLKLFNFQNQ